jgi:hypothetical protein
MDQASSGTSKSMMYVKIKRPLKKKKKKKDRTIDSSMSMENQLTTIKQDLKKFEVTGRESFESAFNAA